MSVTSVSYFTAAGQPAFTTAVSVGLPVYLSAPESSTEFQGARQRYWQVATAYSPAALNTVATYLATTCYLVGEGGFSDVRGGVAEFTREYRRIPDTRIVPAGTYAFKFPAVPAVPLGASKTITAVSGNVYTSAAHGYSAGTYIMISLTYTGGGVTARGRITAVTTDTFTIAVSYTPPGTFSSGTAQEVGPGRTTSKTLPSSAIEVFSYALPGVTSGVTTIQDFRADEIFKVVDTVTGDEVDEVGAGTSPTATEYLAMITSGSYIVAESGVRVWAGNILERRTTMVVAR